MKSFFQLREAALVEGEGIVTPRRKAVGEPEPGSYAYERKYGKYTAKGELRKKPNPNKPPVKEENELEEAKGLAGMSLDQLKQEHDKVKSKIESEGKSKMISMNHPLSQRARAIRLHMAIKQKQGVAEGLDREQDAKLDETKSAPKGFHFTKSGKLKRGDANADGPGGAMLRSDPLDKQRSKVPPVSEAKAPAPGYMLKADPALAKKVKEKQDLHKVRVKAMGNPAAGKSIKEEVDDEGAMAKGQLMQMVSQASMLARMMDDNKQLDGWVQSKLTMAADYLDSVHDYLMHNKQDVDSMEEANGKKSAIYSTDVYGAKAYHSKCLEPGCDWESKRFDSMKLAQNAAQKHAQEHFKKGEEESSIKEAHNPDRTTTHENPLVTVHTKDNGKWELHTHANLSAANKIFQTNVKHSDVHKGPVEVKSGGSYGNVKFAISKHHAAEMEKDKK